MPANKTQHFVPRCHLRPFTRDGEGKAINLFHLAGEGAIGDAKVKKQCAGDYFYGDDLVLEKLLQVFEGAYGTCVRDILAPGYRLTADDCQRLKAFWLLQFLRTDAAARATVEMVDQMDKDLGGLPPGYMTNVKEAVQNAMHLFFEHPDAVADLGVRLVRNRTKRPFITSDNPAVMTNRWHLTDRRAELLGPGLHGAGMTGFLPLSAEVLCVIYDADLYSIEHRDGWAEAAKDEEVDAFNEHQVLSCQSNLYFRDWDDRDYIGDLVSAVRGGRLAARFEVSHAVFDHQEEGADVFREATAEEARGHPRSMIHTQRKLPVPSRWPGIVRWRPGGVVYDSRSGSGFVRSATRTPGEAYKKVKVRA